MTAPGIDPVPVTVTLQGGCLCGKIRYRILPGPADSAYCYCRMCQRASGAPAVAWFTVPHARFAYTTGVPASYRSSAQAVREFCRDCGSPLLFRPDSDPRVDVNTATLDNPAAVPPRYHIWRMSRIGWYETADGLPRFDARGADI